MNILETYNFEKKNFLFNDSKIFSSLRQDILNDIEITPSIKKNNESLRHLDPLVLNFIYKYKNQNNKILYENNDEQQINIDVVDGKILNVKGQNDSYENIIIKNIQDNNIDIEKKFIEFQKYFKKDYILNLNSLMMNSGYEINITKNSEVDINISNSTSEDNLTIFQKNYIKCQKNSKVFIIEEFISDKKSNNNLVNFIELEDGADVLHLIFQKNVEKASLQSTSYVKANQNSKYKQLVLNISKSSVRNHHYANLIGDNAYASFDGIFFGAKNQLIDNKTQVNHNYPNCQSSQRYKGILTDKAIASYLSKTFVNKVAQKTEAYQLSKGILLSDNSYFHSKPELKIYADDVKCSHGSTIGPIDDELLFYLRSRGLSKKTSTSLLIKSFFHDIISDINYKSFIEKFNYHSNIWLKENNI